MMPLAVVRKFMINYEYEKNKYLFDFVYIKLGDFSGH